MSTSVSLVTGASRGIGRQIAIQLGKQGHRVIAMARSEQELMHTQSLVEQSGGWCQAIPIDLTSADAVLAAINNILGDHQRIDVLVNNAGSAPMSEMSDYDVAKFDRMMAINCHAVFYMCRAVWPGMKERRCGTIINLSSVAAIDPFPGFQAYGATKAWVNALTKSLAQEGRAHGISVYAVGPGAVDTGMLRQHFADFPAEQCLRDSDVANAVCWLLEDGAQHASGNIVYVKQHEVTTSS